MGTFWGDPPLTEESSGGSDDLYMTQSLRFLPCVTTQPYWIRIKLMAYSGMQDQSYMIISLFFEN